MKLKWILAHKCCAIDIIRGRGCTEFCVYKQHHGLDSQRLYGVVMCLAVTLAGSLAEGHGRHHTLRFSGAVVLVLSKTQTRL